MARTLGLALRRVFDPTRATELGTKLEHEFELPSCPFLPAFVLVNQRPCLLDRVLGAPGESVELFRRADVPDVLHAASMDCGGAPDNASRSIQDLRQPFASQRHFAG